MFNDLSKRVRAIKPSPTLAVSNLARQLRAQGGDDLHYDVDVANLLLEEVGVALVPGSAFGAEGYMRISFATSMENLQKAVARIRQVLKAKQGSAWLNQVILTGSNLSNQVNRNTAKNDSKRRKPDDQYIVVVPLRRVAHHSS